MAEPSAEEHKAKILEDLKTLRQADLVEQSALELIVSEVTNKDPSWVHRPLAEWNGIKLDGTGRVQSIVFPQNLKGKIQLHGLFALNNLKTFTLEDHSLCGFITFDHLPRGMEYLVCKGSTSASTHGARAGKDSRVTLWTKVSTGADSISWKLLIYPTISLMAARRLRSSCLH